MKTSQFGQAIMARALFFGGLTWGTQTTQVNVVERILDYSVASGINLIVTAESSNL